MLPRSALCTASAGKALLQTRAANRASLTPETGLHAGRSGLEGEGLLRLVGACRRRQARGTRQDA
eukprot:4357845-Pleurochrysis_carterae.AAC.1